MAKRTPRVSTAGATTTQTRLAVLFGNLAGALQPLSRKVKLNTGRFESTPENAVMLDRLEKILKGEL